MTSLKSYGSTILDSFHFKDDQLVAFDIILLQGINPCFLQQQKKKVQHPINK